MLIEFRVKNFRSFWDEQTLSMVAGGAKRDKTRPENLIECGSFSLVKAAAIYGANASGKSNVVQAILAMQEFVMVSARHMNLGDPVRAAVPFRLSLQTGGQPSSFEVAVLLDGATYIYGFSVDAAKVLDEWLEVVPAGGRKVRWIDRRLGEGGQREWTFGGPLKKDAAFLQEKTRDNALILSRGADLNIDALKSLYLWFRKSLEVHDLSDWSDIATMAAGTAKRAAEDQAYRQRIARMLRDADLGISGIRILEQPALRPPENLSGGQREIDLAAKAAREAAGRFAVATQHTIPGTGDIVDFRMDQDESNGTRRLFALAEPILRALDEGCLLVLDELDCSMHPNLTRRLLDLFQSQTANKKGAQLVFATHDSSLLDSGLLRRDQIWFTEKDEHQATQLYSLYDFPVQDRPRRHSALERNYLAGRMGAVPTFGSMFEDKETV